MPATYTDKIDDVDDVMAADVNTLYHEMASGTFRGWYSNTEILTGQKDLTDADLPLQYLDPGGAARDVILPAETGGNHSFVIVNTADAAETITVKTAGDVTIGTVAQGETKVFISNGINTGGLNGWAMVSGGIPYVAPGASGNILTSNGSIWTSAAPTSAGGGPQGHMVNGKLSVTVTSNNLTVALKTLAGADPSAGDKVTIRIGSIEHDITSALSVTRNAATNWCDAGGNLATKEIDYFVYIGYNATDGVVIGFSRIPYATQYSDFSATTTNEKYCAISTITNATATDYYENIGRFAATLSAGAGYTWSVPTFTAINLINRPIYETRWLTWAPGFTGFSSNPTVGLATYKIVSTMVYINYVHGAAGTSNATTFTITNLPVSAVNVGFASIVAYGLDNSANLPYPIRVDIGSTALTLYTTPNGGAWTNSGTKDFYAANFWYVIP
jgi:hypothetical protein